MEIVSRLLASIEGKCIRKDFPLLAYAEA